MHIRNVPLWHQTLSTTAQNTATTTAETLSSTDQNTATVVDAVVNDCISSVSDDSDSGGEIIGVVAIV